MEVTTVNTMMNLVTMNNNTGETSEKGMCMLHIPFLWVKYGKMIQKKGGIKMSDLFEVNDAVLTVHLPQDLDHLQSDMIRKETDRIMRRTYVKKIIFDFENTEFMDSSGIGLIMGRYRALGMGQKCITAVNTDGHIDKLLHLSGVHRYMEIQKKGEEGGDYGKCE